MSGVTRNGTAEPYSRVQIIRRARGQRKKINFPIQLTTSRIDSLTRLIHIYIYIFFHLTYSRWTSSLPSCLWSQRIFQSLPGSRLTIFLSRSKFSTLTTRQPMVEFYLITFPRFPLRKKEHKSYFGKNRTHDFRTSRCAAYLLDHSGDEQLLPLYQVSDNHTCASSVRCCWRLTLQDATSGHPLEAINKARVSNEFEFKMDTARKVYGSAFVMRMKTEVATLSQVCLGGCILRGYGKVIEGGGCFIWRKGQRLQLLEAVW